MEEPALIINNRLTKVSILIGTNYTDSPGIELERQLLGAHQPKSLS
ncbi:MAG: hypothetical protein ACLU4N_03005 [Butyricimonas faecihominis]